MRLSILGAGAWGTALAISLGRRHGVTLWARDAVLAQSMARERRNQRYLPGYDLPEGVAVEVDLERTIEASELIVAATPTNGLRALCAQLARAPGSAALVWVCKGFEADSAKLPHAVVAEAAPDFTRRGVLSGPSFAQEVAAGKPAALTIAAEDAQFAHSIASELSSQRLRVYSSSDVIGVELGGALKNVMAIAAGISDGMGLGNNARAALITRGLAEMSRLAAKLGGQSETLMGLTGLGDLVLTCTGELSRNRRVGFELGQGEQLPEILRRLGHVAEGVGTAREVVKLARLHNVDMPISQAVHAVLYEGLAPQRALQELMTREIKSEQRGSA
jgi:glycerol-3-phosphate dehydrogenase (NAD(P)+)